MSKQPYDISSPQSIRDYAKKLSGKSLSDIVDLEGIIENVKHKGDLGTMVEELFFSHTPPNDHKPDFPEAGVELKTTGVKKDSKGRYKAKERLVLSMINYMTLVEEDWDTNSLMNKCRLMLLLFYLYEKSLPVYKRKFVYEPILWDFPESDLKIIEKDWKKIQEKIKQGRAHELSEGDTFYLGACRKGSGGPKESLRRQPYSDIKAKSRAFSLKPSYINTILSNHATESVLVENAESAKRGLESATTDKFKRFIGMDVNDIAKELDCFKNGKNDKGYYRRLTMRMLGTTGRIVPELEKAGIHLKTIRLSKAGSPKEYMSFPAFKYMDIIEEEWEESVFFEKIEQKFLFVVFKFDNEGILRLHKVLYWNMPYDDREEARKVWEETKQRIINNDAENLPKIIDNRVAHVRPKAANSKDTIPTPQGLMLPKKCFWLNKKYIASQLT